MNRWSHTHTLARLLYSRPRYSRRHIALALRRATSTETYARPMRPRRRTPQALGLYRRLAPRRTLGSLWARHGAVTEVAPPRPTRADSSRRLPSRPVIPWYTSRRGVRDNAQAEVSLRLVPCGVAPSSADFAQAGPTSLGDCLSLLLCTPGRQSAWPGPSVAGMSLVSV